MNNDDSNKVYVFTSVADFGDIRMCTEPAPSVLHRTITFYVELKLLDFVKPSVARDHIITGVRNLEDVGSKYKVILSGNTAMIEMTINEPPHDDKVMLVAEQYASQIFKIMQAKLNPRRFTPVRRHTPKELPTRRAPVGKR